ncbi:hypothetical protein [Bradyrhizobium sp. CB3481]|uniref:hypothetical protein n=1 Tax=Bradyrhizobium sp. CB3481 TaxID=3039158 RepID=UPI0024B181E0|nr:hypothetical protein [Bradyrhizobium sp. CB3481]WFU14931.1 hypothetical protein QA643_28670 [Bradyrhizobium sp. CB3481]
MTLIQRLIDAINDNAAAKLDLTQLCETRSATRGACNIWKYLRWLGRGAPILGVGLSLLCHAQPASALEAVCMRNHTAENEAYFFVDDAHGNRLGPVGPIPIGKTVCVDLRGHLAEGTVYGVRFAPRLKDVHVRPALHPQVAAFQFARASLQSDAPEPYLQWFGYNAEFQM